MVKKNEKKELVDVDSLSFEEHEELEKEFFNDYPNYNEFDEKLNELFREANLFKMSPFVKFFMILGIVLALLGLAILIISKGESSFFKVPIILSFVCLFALIIASIIDNKKTNERINKISQFQNTLEYKEYNKVRVEWYKNKGYYYPNEFEDDEDTDEE